MMGENDNQGIVFHTVQIEDLVPADHPLRRIRKMVNTERIRELCAPLYCANNGRPGIPPEQVFPAMLGGYLMGVRSDRKLIMELQCNMAFRWFAGLDISSKIWDDSSFSKNRERRFDKSDIMERLFDDTVKTAMKEGLVSTHRPVGGTLVRADASHKSFVPVEALQKPEEYRKIISGRRAEKKEADRDDDKGNPSVDFRGEKRSNATRRSTTDPDARIATKSSKETAVPAYTVNGATENRNRIPVGIGVETFRGPLSEREGALNLLDRARRRLKPRPQSLGADKGYFEGRFIGGLPGRKVEPHIAAQERGHGGEYMRVRMRQRSAFYKLSQRARKKIEELWGEAKEEHGFRRFCRRTLENARQEALMMGWLLNLKRLTAIHAATAG